MAQVALQICPRGMRVECVKFKIHIQISRSKFDAFKFKTQDSSNSVPFRNCFFPSPCIDYIALISPTYISRIWSVGVILLQCFKKSKEPVERRSSCQLRSSLRLPSASSLSRVVFRLSHLELLNQPGSEENQFGSIGLIVIHDI